MKFLKKLFGAETVPTAPQQQGAAEPVSVQQDMSSGVTHDPFGLHPAHLMREAAESKGEVHDGLPSMQPVQMA